MLAFPENLLLDLSLWTFNGNGQKLRHKNSQGADRVKDLK